MTVNWPVIWELDASDRIVGVSGGWETFARENRGEAVTRERVVGRSLWDFVHDVGTRRIYASMLARVRAGAAPMAFRFRCDAPGFQRLLAMRMDPAGEGGVRFRVDLVTERARRPLALLDPGVARGGGTLDVCGWCERILVARVGWLEPDEAIARTRTFEREPFPVLNHGICPECSERLMGLVDDPEAASSGTVQLGAHPKAGEGDLPGAD